MSILLQNSTGDFGIAALITAVGIGAVVGAVFGISLMLLAKRGRNVPIPFGPYLAVAGAVALFWGKPLTYAYLKLL